MFILYHSWRLAIIAQTADIRGCKPPCPLGWPRQSPCWLTFMVGFCCEEGQDGMNSGSVGFSPMRLRIAAFASIGQCDGNGLFDRFCLCRRMAGANRSIPV